MLYVEFSLEILRVCMLAVIGIVVWHSSRRIRQYKVISNLMLITGILLAMMFVAAIADMLDAPMLENKRFSGLTQILLEDGLFLLSILGATFAIYRFMPILIALETTTEVLRRHEGELIGRERNEIRLHEELASLRQIDRQSYNEILPEVLERVASTLGASRASIWLFTDERDAIVCEDLYDVEAAEHRRGEIHFRIDLPKYFDAIENYRIIRAIDAKKDVRTEEFSKGRFADAGIQSLCDVVLDVPGVISGIICVESTERIRNWSHEEVSFIRAAGDFIFLEYARERILESNLALQKTKAEFQAIADYTYSWEMWLDSAGKVLWVNTAVERITGYSVEECLAMPDFPVCLADGDAEKERFAGYMASAVRGVVADAMETIIRDHNGNRLIIELSWQPVKGSEMHSGVARMSIRDVSQRKRTEVKLREEENRRREAFTRLQSFLETTPAAIVQSDMDGTIVDWNASAVRVFGWSRDEVVGKQIGFMIPDAEVVARIEEWRDGEDDGLNYMTQTNSNLCKNGEVIICEWHNTLIRDEQGAPVSVYASALDKTEQVLSHRRVEAEREKLEDFSRSASDFFWEIDADGVISYASERLFEFVELSPEELYASKLEDFKIFFNAGNKGEVLSAIDARQPFRELELSGFTMRGGRPLSLSLSATPVYAEDGTYQGYRGTGRNTLEEMQQKTVERLIYMNVQGMVGEDYFGALVKNLVDVLEIDWAFIGEINRSDEQKVRVISGFGPDGEIVPFTYSLVGSASAITSEEGYCLYVDDVNGLFPQDAMLQRLGAKGFAGIRLNDTQGHLIGLLILASSERIQSPDILRHALNVFYPRVAAELYRKWSDREREILQNQFLHSQRMETMGKLAGGIAHDFNNVLTPILGYAEILVDDLDEDSSSRNDAASILRGAKRARDLVDQILNFSRRADTVHSSVFDVARVIRNTVEFVSITLPAHIQINLSISDNENTVLGDSSKIDQLVMNLITNAWHAIGDDEGEIAITVKTVTLTANEIAMKPPLQASENVEIVVRDTGSGISSDTLTRIFEPFFTTKGSGKGTGFGLSTVKGIVESMGGVIDVQSRLGEGSTFTVLIPTATAKAIQEPRNGDVSVSAFAMASRLKSTSLSLLYVDDEEENAKMASRMLEKLGHRVTIFDAPEAALAAFRENPSYFDMLITDDSMPGMTGSVLSGEILQLSPHLPVVVVSGGSGTLAAERYAPLGISLFVAKPFDAGEIDAAIKSAVETTISNIMSRM
jgi:PAS domain S-box-containing protein